MNWTKFADDVVNQRSVHKTGIMASSNPYAALTRKILDEEALSKEHFAVSKSSLVEIMEDAYFPLIDIHETTD